MSTPSYRAKPFQDRVRFYFSGIDTDEDADGVRAYLAESFDVSEDDIELKRSGSTAIVKVDTGGRDVSDRVTEALYQRRRSGYLGQEF